MGAIAEGSASKTTDAAPEDVWHHISNATRLPAWWPKAERAEDVQGGLFTLVLRSSRGVPVRTDWTTTTSKRPEVQRWEQQIVNTPFEKALKTSVVEIRLEPSGDGTRITVTVERELIQKGMLAARMGRKASKEQAGLALDGLLRVISSAG
ncbi:SRPBCC family protein [Patulibacter minatonensis]|uniref:SRPBCC family protein n=1 Tax=Patulibacter minatonensis TaxID=298163 RepID=UPI00047E4DF3|nr:SRPBCC domain-containing protein [Patulibacter minatonensis]